MGTQLIANNLSFKNLVDLPNKNTDPNAVIDELRQLELEVKQQAEDSQNVQDNSVRDEIRYMDVPMIPTNKLVLPESGYMALKIDKSESDEASEEDTETREKSTEEKDKQDHSEETEETKTPKESEDQKQPDDTNENSSFIKLSKMIEV